jgi:large subunit ribosomal protein L25
MARVEVRAQERTVYGKQVRQLRAEAWIPAVLYGPDTTPRAIQAQERPLFKALQQAGQTALIDLYIGNEPAPTVVLTREVQHNAINGRLLHVDFYQVRLTEKVKTSPHLRFVGESPAVRLGLGVLLHNMTEVEVECLPTDLISAIEVDVSALESLDDNVLVRDLTVPAGVTILADPEEIVASVVPTRMAKGDEEVAAAPAEAEAQAEEE